MGDSPFSSPLGAAALPTAAPLVTYDAIEPANHLQQVLAEAGIDSHVGSRSHDVERIVPTEEPGGWTIELDDVTSFTVFVDPEHIDRAREVLAALDAG